MIALPGRFGGIGLVAAVCASIACENGFFAPGAPPRHQATLSLATTSATAGDDGTAFDRADALHVRLTRGTQPALDSVVAFHSAGAETRVGIAVDLSTSPETLGLEAELRSGGAALFRATTSVTLKTGETTPVDLALVPVPAAVAASAPTPPFTSIGDTAWAHGQVVFSTGDAVRGLLPTWTSATPAIVAVLHDSMLVARGEGQGQLQASYGSLTASFPVTVNATPVSLAISPQNPSVPRSGPPVQFSALARDRRGNALSRSFTWSSSNASVASISAQGVATPLSAGTTFIGVTLGSLRDSTRLTVVASSLGAPTNLTATPVSSAEINLSWTDNAVNESGYQVERCAGVNCTGFVRLATIGPYGFYRDYSLPASSAYTYRVRAYSASDTSAYSNAVTALTLLPETVPPAAPTALSATAISGTQVSLQWTNSATNEVGTYVERCTGLSCTSFVQVISIPFANINGVYDGTVAPGTTYSYRVRNYNRAGTSAYSNVATVTTPAAGALPNPPSSLTAYGGSSQEITLDFNDNSTDETYFSLERCQGSGCTGFVEVYRTSTGWVTAHTGAIELYDAYPALSPSTSYSYRVRAANANGFSAYSNVATASTLPLETTPPVAPDSLRATVVSGSSIDVEWHHTWTNVVGFNVERCAGANCSNFTLVRTLYGHLMGGIVDGSLSPATSYSYRVQAFNAAGTSAYSNVATATTP